MYFLINEEFKPDGNVRELASELALYSVIAMTIFVVLSVTAIKEKPEFQKL